MKSKLALVEKEVINPGYRRAYVPTTEKFTDGSKLGSCSQGARVKVRARVRQARGITVSELLRLMQQCGVGRPSTYAATINALVEHGYIEEQRGKLLVTARGRQVLYFLAARYPFLLDVGFSADLESQLDELAKGRVSYKSVVRSVWERLQPPGAQENMP